MREITKKERRFVIVALAAALTAAACGAVSLNAAFADDSDMCTASGYVEDLPMLYVGETMQLDLRQGDVVVSDNVAVARVSSSGKVTARGYGKANISVYGDSGERSVTLIVKDKYDDGVLGQRAHFPARQGENGFYVYNCDNGDIENNLELGLAMLDLMSEKHSTGTGWWNGISFIGNDHFGGRGAGALSFKATYPGNYTVDYSAWLLGSIRTNPDYYNWNVDGFTTGIAKKSTDGSITVLASDVGTKASVVADSTRYHTASVTADLDFGEELMMFFCSNGNGDCDEVYTEFFVKTNEITGEPLYVLPPNTERFDGDLKINIGDTLGLTAREGAEIEIDDARVAEVADGGIKGVGYGSTRIVVKDGDDSADLMLFVDRRRSDGTVSLSKNLPAAQGDNNMYIYWAANGDYAAGLSELAELPDAASALTSWSTDNIFVNGERAFINGTGAVAFAAPVDGKYTVDYYAYLKSELRNDPKYLNEWDTDGFTTGLARRDALGNIEPIAVNIGDRQSVVAASTRRQTDTAELELRRGEAAMFFFSSNETADCDEITAGFYVSCDTADVFDGNVNFPADIATVNNAALLYTGDVVRLKTAFGGKLDYVSSNEAVATVDENGEITAKGVGTAVITVGDAFKSSARVVTVRNKLSASDTVVDNDVPASQGDKGLRVYSGPDGDIENDLANGLKDIPLIDERYYNAAELSWWKEPETYLNASHVFTRGVGILGYTVTTGGSYGLQYLSCLMPDIYNDANYPTYENCDGFTVGLMQKKANGEIVVLASDVNTRFSLVADATRMLVKDCVIKADAGDELCFFWVSNGNGDCDEIYYEFDIRRVYDSDDERPTEITFDDKLVRLDIGVQKTLGLDVKYAHGKPYEWSVSDSTVATVADGTVVGVSAGSCLVTLRVGDAEASVAVYVTERLSYTVGSGAGAEFRADTFDAARPVYMVRMNGKVVDKSAYVIKNGKVVFASRYLDALDDGEKKLEFFFEGNKIVAYLSVLR